MPTTIRSRCCVSTFHLAGRWALAPTEVADLYCAVVAPLTPGRLSADRVFSSPTGVSVHYGMPPDIDSQPHSRLLEEFVP
jgi:hypothetical protein